MNALNWLKNTLIPSARPTVKAGPAHPDCIHHYIEERAEESPHEVAVVFDNRELTYSELNRRANKLARHLQKRGAGPERVVGLGLKRSEQLLVGLLAIWKSGAAYVPLESKLPKERLAYLVGDSRPVCILTEEPVRGVWEGFGEDLIFIDTGWPEISRESDDMPECRTNGSNLAQLLYTS